MPEPKLLTIRTREDLHPAEGEPRQIVEVCDGETVLGQLPVNRVAYEMLPTSLGKLTFELVVNTAQIKTAP